MNDLIYFIWCFDLIYGKCISSNVMISFICVVWLNTFICVVWLNTYGRVIKIKIPIFTAFALKWVSILYIWCLFSSEKSTYLTLKSDHHFYTLRSLWILPDSFSLICKRVYEAMTRIQEIYQLFLLQILLMYEMF